MLRSVPMASSEKSRLRAPIRRGCALCIIGSAGRPGVSLASFANKPKPHSAQNLMTSWVEFREVRKPQDGEFAELVGVITFCSGISIDRFPTSIILSILRWPARATFSGVCAANRKCDANLFGEHASV
jgi:hypothetical protein